jgi:hypothetical protein
METRQTTFRDGAEQITWGPRTRGQDAHAVQDRFGRCVLWKREVEYQIALMQTGFDASEDDFRASAGQASPPPNRNVQSGDYNFPFRPSVPLTSLNRLPSSAIDPGS